MSPGKSITLFIVLMGLLQFRGGANAQEAPLRKLMVFAPDASDLLYKVQMENLALAQTGMKERDLLIVPCLGDDEAHKHFHVALSEFCIILIGKDGTEKFRALQPISEEKLFGLIDAMPMRKREMRER